MITISKQISWEMGHALSEPYVGKCQRLHGHHFIVEFSYEGELDERGMVLDFAEFSVMKDWINQHLDHRFYVKKNHPILEPYFEDEDEWSREIDELGLVPVDFNPTSENFAKFLHEVCCSLMDLESKSLSVTVHETCTSSATYKDNSPISERNNEQTAELFADLKLFRGIE